MAELADALRDLDEEKVYQLVEARLRGGIPPLTIVGECNAGMVAVGELFSSGEYFLSDLIFSAEIFKAVMGCLEPLLQDGSGIESFGKVVIGTVKGDIHDIGKNVVASLLRGHGFEVVDLGVDVPAERFVAAAQETGAKVLGMSALLNITYQEMKNVVQALAEAGLRDKVTVVIGGRPCNELVRQFVGADFYAPDAVAGVAICSRVYGSDAAARANAEA
ncbi:MAG: corrinoid protein [Chloroflexi bacterium]|nr:corrinoid protein [Chloroflexota bacterium]